MTKEAYQAVIEANASLISQIKESAHELHRSVNQTYGDQLPYSFHLDMVVKTIRDYGYLVCASPIDVVPLFFGGYYHDSIEDARLTYNDVLNTARQLMTEEQALLATEIVYALTNDKGRTRAERAGDKYYQGIRQTPYAPFVKLCDRLANVSYSCNHGDPHTSNRMKVIYKQEMPHFLSCIDPHSDDQRFQLPEVVIELLAECLIDDLEREERNGPSPYTLYHHQ